MAIGADWNDGAASSAGHVRIYKNIGGTWTQLGSDIDGAGWSSYFGHDLALSSDGSIVAIGGWGNDSNSLSSNGYAQVYEYDNTSDSWTQVGSTIYGTWATRSGTSLSLNSDGTILAIGAPYYDPPGESSFSNSGQIRVFERDDANATLGWTQIGSDIYGEEYNDLFGRSVELNSDGSILAAGGYDNTYQVGSGVVRVYENIGGTWTKIGIDIFGEASGDESGAETSSIALNSDGNIMVIGANSQSNSSGYTRVFEKLPNGGVFTMPAQNVSITANISI